MSVFSLIEQMLRGVAFLAQITTFIMLHIIEYAIRPLYYPLFGTMLKNILKREPNEFITQSFAYTFMAVYNIKVVALNDEQLKNKEAQPYIVMYTHGSNLDPLALQYAMPFKLHFVAKKQLFSVPLMGQALHTMGAIPIDRGNLEKAKESLNKAAEYIKSKNKSVSIAPEGTRRRKNSDVEPRIARFKKGPFHLAKACNVNIMPVIICGAFRLWPPGKPFIQPGVVYVNFLPAFPKEKIKDLTVEQLLDEVQKVFDKGMEEVPKNLPYTHNEKSYGWFLFFLSFFVFWVWVYYKLFHMIF